MQCLGLFLPGERIITSLFWIPVDPPSQSSMSSQQCHTLTQPLCLPVWHLLQTLLNAVAHASMQVLDKAGPSIGALVSQGCLLSSWALCCWWQQQQVLTGGDSELAPLRSIFWSSTAFLAGRCQPLPRLLLRWPQHCALFRLHFTPAKGKHRW